jgi:hypothetical protein
VKSKMPNRTRPEPPPWVVIITVLALASISAWLVFMCEWEPWKALFVVGFSALGIIFALLAVLMILAPREERSELWKQVWQTCGNDLDLLLKYFRIKR